MSYAENMRNRIEKLSKHLLEYELAEMIDTPITLALSSGALVRDQRLITCPVCSEVIELPIEGVLSEDSQRWVYFDDICENCDTHFRLGEVQEKCALCQNPLLSEPYYDINELNHHWCEKDGQTYCTPCFMQLFFDGYIDLSSDSIQLEEDDSKTICRPRPTDVGHSVDAYRSRLQAGGFEEVAAFKEWVDTKHLCQEIVKEGCRYLILSTTNEGLEQDHEYVVFKKPSQNHTDVIGAFGDAV